jgi:hypothetical protein
MAVIASSAVASAARPQLDTVGIGVGVGAGVLSNVTEVESVVAFTCVPAFPAKSLKSIVKATTPSVSPVDRSKVAVQLLPLTLVTVTDPTVEAAPTVTVTVGAPIVSLAVNESVTVSPTIAISFVPILVALSESMDTLLSVGAVLSNVTEEESVVAVTWVPVFPAVSLKSIVKATTPSVSPEARSKVALQSFPLTLETVTDPIVEASPTVKATDGVWIVSSAVNEIVTVSPTVAVSSVPILVALFESIDTLVSVGAVLSNVTEEESVVEVTWVPALLDMSLKSIVNATAPSVSPEARSKVALQ